MDDRIEASRGTSCSDRLPIWGVRACVLRRQYSEPVGRRTLSIRCNASAPADSRPKQQTSNVWVELFVVRGRMSRLRRQLPASRDQYHGKRDGESILGRTRALTGVHFNDPMRPAKRWTTHDPS